MDIRDHIWRNIMPSTEFDILLCCTTSHFTKYLFLFRPMYEVVVNKHSSLPQKIEIDIITVRHMQKATLVCWCYVPCLTSRTKLGFMSERVRCCANLTLTAWWENSYLFDEYFSSRFPWTFLSVYFFKHASGWLVQGPGNLRLSTYILTNSVASGR